MDRSRIPEFYKQSVHRRLELLQERTWLNAEDYARLDAQEQIISLQAADKMVENVVGVFGLPMGLGLNFLINGDDYVVPLVVEEPSIIAALSSAAKVVRQAGGFEVDSDAPLLIGQIQVVNVPAPERARALLLRHKQDILDLANSLHPNMLARGGGAKELEVRIETLPDAEQPREMLVAHLLVDTCDAMGANLVNTMCEGIASRIEELTDGKVFLRILSNLADRAMVRARCTIPTAVLAGKGYTGEAVRDGVILANDFARVDLYRAVTHNKGVMNGIDAVALATGNDWRAIEASVHAWAGRGVGYTSLTQWRKNAQGDLEGSIELPLKVGVVGGNFGANPAVQVAHRLLKRPSARRLAEIMAAVGLAQNFSALKALATDGIQQGHMTLHARSIVASTETPAALFDEVVEKLIQSGQIKQWKAQEILETLQNQTLKKKVHHDGQRTAQKTVVENQITVGEGVGKVLFTGEHAVVYGSHALAVPVPLAIRTRIIANTEKGVHLLIPDWGIEGYLHHNDKQNSLHRSLELILEKLGLDKQSMTITVDAKIPRAMGLGGSAALAVSVVRALSMHFRLALDAQSIIALAFEAEKVAHGNPSGVDNALAALAKPLLFKRGSPPEITPVGVGRKMSVVLGLSRTESLTAKTVAQVEKAWRRHPKLHEDIFKQIDTLTLQAARAMQDGHLELLGELMNINHGLLNALQVSTDQLEDLVAIARKHGALGAKLTGGGGGGSMVALCDGNAEKIVDAMHKAGYRALITDIHPIKAVID